MPKMYQNTFGGRDPTGPAGALKRSPRSPSHNRGVLLLRGGREEKGGGEGGREERGREGRGRKGKGRGREGRELGREGREGMYPSLKLSPESVSAANNTQCHHVTVPR